jgi:cell division protein FtsZ
VVATGVDINAANLPRPAAAPAQPAAPPQGAPLVRAPVASAAPAPRPQPAPDAKSIEQHESRIAELAQRLKADNARIAQRIETPPQRPPAAAPQAAAPLAPPQRAVIDQVATAAVAAALSPESGEEVVIRSLPPKPSLFADPVAQGTPETSAPKAFIPPQPERPHSRMPRMPSFEEFPVPGQKEFQARRGEVNDADHPEKRRLSLLQRLAAVGLGRREDEEPKPESHPPEPSRGPTLDRAPHRAAPRQNDSREPVSDYAKRGVPQGLDIHGRPMPLRPAGDDDQLDIPAFLRRQGT